MNLKFREGWRWIPKARSASASKFLGTPETKDSRTQFKVLERYKNHALVECVPLTGRTNQIRVHLAHAGFPIAGDKLYGRLD